MSEKDNKLRGLNVLCIDGGGVRGLSSLLLLSEAMKRLERLDNDGEPLHPTKFFDIIAGTGTGGMAACMLGRLQMPIDMVIKKYVTVLEDIFSAKKSFVVSGPSAYKGRVLREALKSMVKEATGNENERMIEDMEEGNHCKTMVFAMSKRNMRASVPVIFQSYQASCNPGPDCAIWEAIYATMAHPDLFKSIDINLGSTTQSFVGGELGCSNPLAHLLAEIKCIYPDRHLSCIFSIGSGHPRTIHIPDPSPSRCSLRMEEVAAIKDMATDGERVAEEMAIRFQATTGVYYRFNVDQGIQSVGVDDWERLSEVAAHTQTYITKVEETRRMEQAIQAIRSRKCKLAAGYIDGHIHPSLAKKITRRCPAPTVVFTGRHDYIKQAEACLIGGPNERRVCVIHGLGGVGKTQLSLKVIERNRNKWSFILYMDASSRESLEVSLQRFAESRSIGKWHTYEDTIEWLENHHEEWLVVFDNADDQSLNIHHYLPGGDHGKIIITTRLPELAVHARGPGAEVHLSVLTQTEGLSLLLRAARLSPDDLSEDERTSTIALIGDFGCLALAIVQAGACISHLNMKVAEFRTHFLDHRQRTLEQYNRVGVRIDGYKKTVYNTWTMCYELLESDSRLMLWLIAFLHYDGITEEIFRHAANNMQSYSPVLPMTETETAALRHIEQYLSRFITSNGDWDVMRFSAALGQLVSFSLVQFDRVNLTYGIHLLVQDWARNTSPQRPDFAFVCATTLLSLSVGRDLTNESYTFKQTLLLHVNKALSNQISPTGANHLDQMAKVYAAVGNWRREESLQTQIHHERKRVLGKRHPRTLDSMIRLSQVYSKLGAYGRAEEKQLEALELLKRPSGKLCEQALHAMDELAWTYMHQGRLAEAEPLIKDTLRSQRRLLGRHDDDALFGIRHLACLYRAQGKWHKATLLDTRALNASRRRFGETHPQTLASIDGLMSSYVCQEQWDRAIELSMDLLQKQKLLIGDDHPDALAALNNLAVIHSRQKKWDEAEKLQLRVLDSSKIVLGELHPTTLRYASNLAGTYLRQNRLDSAKPLMIDVLKMQEAALGKQHPDTIATMSNVCSLYRQQCRWCEAEPLAVAVLQGSSKQFGENHPETLRSMGHLGLIYLRRGKLGEAQSILLHVFEGLTKSLGETHPSTLDATANLADMYARQEQWNKAEPIQLQMLHSCRKAFGKEDPASLRQSHLLAVIYAKQERLDEAKHLLEELLGQRERVLGIDHVDTLESKFILARIYACQGRWDKAEALALQALSGRRRTLGKNHPDTADVIQFIRRHTIIEKYTKIENIKEQPQD